MAVDRAESDDALQVRTHVRFKYYARPRPSLYEFLMRFLPVHQSKSRRSNYVNRPYYIYIVPFYPSKLERESETKSPAIILTMYIYRFRWSNLLHENRIQVYIYVRTSCNRLTAGSGARRRDTRRFTSWNWKTNDNICQKYDSVSIDSKKYKVFRSLTHWIR